MNSDNAQIIGGKIVKEVSLNAASLSTLPQGRGVPQLTVASQSNYHGGLAPDRELYGAPTIQQQSFVSGLQSVDLNGGGAADTFEQPR